MSWIVTASAVIRGATVAQIGAQNFRVNESEVFISFNQAFARRFTVDSPNSLIGKKIDIRVQKKVSADGRFVRWTGYAIGELK